MMNAIIVITHLWNTDLVHWWHLYFDPAEKPWYEGQIWGNVFAVLPLAVLGFIGYWVHKFITKEHEDIDARLERHHDEHSKHLKAILDALDPDTEGGIADVHVKLDAIKNELNPETEGGLKVLLDRIEGLESKSQQTEKS